MDVGIDFEHDHTTTKFWFDGGELNVIAQHKFTDSHMSVMTLDHARQLRDWLSLHINDPR